MRLLPTLPCLLALITKTHAQQHQPIPLTIMPLGDSITELGCWRAYLYRNLTLTSNITNISYVGSMSDRPEECPGTPYPKLHEGHAGHQAIDIANKPEYLATWLKPFMPDVVIMHLGTVDIVFNKQMKDTLAAFDRIVDMVRGKKAGVVFVVAQIVPIPTSAAKVVAFNKALPGWAEKKRTADSPIVLVDQYTGFDAATGLQSDGLHPNDVGDRRIADVWFPAVLKVIEGLQNGTMM